jgi:hypothetical protein
VAIPSNNSFFNPIRRAATCALPAAIPTRASSCPLFHAARLPREEGQVNQRVLPPREGFLEVNLAQRFAVLSIISSPIGKPDVNAEMNEERKNRMDYWWIIAVIVAWVVLQAYILPKFGIST